MTPVTVREGTSAVVLAFPHSGTFLPDDVHDALNDTGRLLSDTDWHLPRLYEGLLPNATTVTAQFHRYAIDANRDPSGASLYPGQATTGLIPETDFDGNPIRATAADETLTRDLQARFHRPYHEALAAQLSRVHASHGYAILYDCHSIRSRIPRLFDGILPDFNIGTFDGKSCDFSIQDGVLDVCAAANGYASILNGRFKGGWTTRHYGRPGEGFHAIQMELAQSTHLRAETSPWDYAPRKAERLRAVLSDVLGFLDAWRPG